MHNRLLFNYPKDKSKVIKWVYQVQSFALSLQRGKPQGLGYKAVYKGWMLYNVCTWAESDLYKIRVLRIYPDFNPELYQSCVRKYLYFHLRYLCWGSRVNIIWVLWYENFYLSKLANTWKGHNHIYSRWVSRGEQHHKLRRGMDPGGFWLHGQCTE